MISPLVNLLLYETKNQRLRKSIWQTVREWNAFIRVEIEKKKLWHRIKQGEREHWNCVLNEIHEALSVLIQWNGKNKRKSIENV